MTARLLLWPLAPSEVFVHFICSSTFWLIAQFSVFFSFGRHPAVMVPPTTTKVNDYGYSIQRWKWRASTGKNPFSSSRNCVFTMAFTQNVKRLKPHTKIFIPFHCLQIIPNATYGLWTMASLYWNRVYRRFACRLLRHFCVRTKARQFNGLFGTSAACTNVDLISVSAIIITFVALILPYYHIGVITNDIIVYSPNASLPPKYLQPFCTSRGN